MSEFIQKVYEDYSNILDDTRDWRVERDRLRKFYYGQQYSGSLSSTYRDRGWVDIVINKIRPLLRSRVSMLVASKPQGKVYGVHKGDMSTAQALEEFMDFHHYNSDGQLVMEDGVMSSQREGVGYLIVYADNMANYGQGELKIAHETYENVFVKKTSKIWDYKDAGRIIHSRLVNRDDFILRNRKKNGSMFTKGELDQFLHLYDIPYWEGKEKHQTLKEIGLHYETAPGEFGEFVREFDVYDRFYKDVRLLYYVPTSTVEILPDNYQLTPNEKELIKRGIIQERVGPVPRIKFTKCLANSTSDGLQIAQAELPIEFFPIVPIHDERTGNSCSLGEVDFYAGLQEMLNQSTSLMILHASLASLFRIIVDSNSGIDLKTFRKEFSVPGGVTAVPFDKITGKPPIEVFKPDQINQAFWQMVMHWGTELEYEAQMHPMNWGDPNKAPETFSATMQIHEWAQNALRLPLNHTEMAIQRIYEVLLQWSRTFYGYKTFEVIRNEEPAEQFINAPIPYPTGLDKSGKQLTSRHDIRSLRARFRIKMGSTAPSQSVAYMAMYQQLAQQYPVFLKQFVQYLDIPADEKREMVQAVDVVGQQQATIQEQQQAIEYLQKVIQKLQTQDVEHQKEHKIDQYEKQIIKKVSKLTADMERVKDKLELKGERAVQQLENEKTKLQSKPADAGD